MEDFERWWHENVRELKAFGWGIVVGTVVTAIYTVIKK